MGFNSVNMDLNTTQPFHFMQAQCVCMCVRKFPPLFFLESSLNARSVLYSAVQILVCAYFLATACV